jgi:ArsR family transcriptional regulator
VVEPTAQVLDYRGARATPDQIRPARGWTVSTPLYQAKAEFFKALGHPARIRVLELLAQREHAVSELLPQVGIEPAHLSQQLAILRRLNLIVSRKEGTAVFYSLVSPQVAELLRIARQILTDVLAVQVELLDDLNAAPTT